MRVGKGQAGTPREAPKQSGVASAKTGCVLKMSVTATQCIVLSAPSRCGWHLSLASLLTVPLSLSAPSPQQDPDEL